MNEKVAIVTGANSGLGRATAGQLAGQDFQVVLACRDEVRGEAVKKQIVAATGNKGVYLLRLDLADLASVRAFADNFMRDFNRLDVLINNAAVFRRERVVTPDGFETNFATNHLGPFLLTNLLLETLKASAPARVITVTAPSTTKLDFEDLQAEKKFGGTHAFGASKMGNLLFGYALAKRLDGSGVTSNLFFPGLVKSNLLNEVPVYIRVPARLLSADPEKAARPLVYLATDPAMESANGKNFKGDKGRVKEIKSSPYAMDEQVQQQLWDSSLKLAEVD